MLLGRCVVYVVLTEKEESDIYFQNKKNNYNKGAVVNMNIAFMNQDIQMEEHIKKANCVHINMSQQIK